MLSLTPRWAIRRVGSLCQHVQLLDLPSIVRVVSAHAGTGPGGSSRSTARHVKKVYHSQTLEELPKVRTGLESLDQAKQVAMEARERHVRPSKGHTLQQSASLNIGHKVATGGVRVVDDRDEENLGLDDFVKTEEADDKLPEGLSFKDLPRFKRIHGWDRDNRQLRRLKSSLSHLNKNDDTVLLESKRLIVDAMNLGFYPSTFVFSRLNLLDGFPFDLAKPLAMYQIPYRNISAWSDLKTHPGFMAAFNRQDIETKVAQRTAEKPDETLPITLVLDNVRGPDNMGALLRVAAAAGCRRVITLKGCVDPWQSKVTRAAAGAHLVMPIVKNVPWHQINSHLPRNAQVVLADLDRSDEESDRQQMDPKELSRRLSALDDRCQPLRWQTSHLPNIPDIAPSLEVTEEELEGKDDEEVARIVHSAVRDSVTPAQPGSHGDFSFYEEDIVREFCALPLPSRQCWAFQHWSDDQDVVVIVGGETAGMGPCAKKLAHERLGERLYIPVRECVDSLNVACAASVILFEIVRKLQTKGNSSP